MELVEFKEKLKLKYTFGVSRADGASRRYHDEDMNIGAEIHTPKDEKTGKWGKEERYYYIEDSEKTFDSIEGLYKAYEKISSIRNGLTELAKLNENN